MTISAPITLSSLAQRFDTIADASQGVAKAKAARNAQQLRFVAQRTIQGAMTTDQAWIWADAAAGQLLTDDNQLERKARR